MEFTADPSPEFAVKSSALGGVIFTAAARRLSERAATLDDAAAVADMDTQSFLARAGELIDSSLAAVLMAYLSVEAAVNELLLAHQLGHLRNMPGLDAGLAQRFSQTWDAGASKLNAMEKADLARITAGLEPTIWGEGAAQQVGLLHDLRNELVHHKPKWVEPVADGSASKDKLERSLHQLFAPATIWHGRFGTTPFRWNGCLGAGCARWAYKAACAFNVEFYDAVGTKFVAADVCGQRIG
jgi:hypothetical protein